MPRPSKSPIKLAQKLLKGGEDDMELLREHDFKNELAMHDDTLHEKLCQEFSAEVDRIQAELSEEYGKPLRTSGTDSKYVPLNGVVRYAVWQVGKRHLYVAAAREERECPFLLILGVTAKTWPRQ